MRYMETHIAVAKDNGASDVDALWEALAWLACTCARLSDKVEPQDKQCQRKLKTKDFTHG